MELKAKIENDLHDAMRNHDELRKRTLRMVLANIKLTEVEKIGTLSDVEVISILQKEIKNRKEAIQDAEKANRSDLIDSNNDEIGVLTDYLPRQLTENELIEIAKQAMAEVNAQNPNDVGKVMKVLIPRIQGRAPNDRVSQIIRILLQK
jgi:uncharacterized protein YqeY